MKTLVMNVRGNGHEPKGLKLEPGKKQRDVAVNIIKSYKPDLVLAQEGMKIFYDRVCEECKDGVFKYECVYNKDAGILYNAVDWTVEMPKFDLEKLYDNLVYENIISRDSELRGSRFHALLLKSKGPDGDFLCVTFHGQYTGKTENKKLEILKDFLKLLCHYLQRNPYLPLILGGDFNVALDDATLQTLIQNGKKEQMLKSLSGGSKYMHGPNESEKYTRMPYGSGMFPPTPSNRDLYLVPYEPTGNRANIYDHIIVSSTVIVSKIQAVDVFKKIKELFPEVSKEYYSAILDHDSIFVTFKVYIRKM